MREDNQMAAPAWKWEWNLNTLVVLIGFASGFVAWGYTLADIKAGRTTNQENIAVLTTRVAANETTLRRIDNHELRITNMEKAATDAADTMKSLDKTLNDLASDMRVTKEILQCIEAAQKVRFQP
jgi:hypothetical protein